MVGIVLASHGDFANGILQSVSMIFGEQQDVKAVTLQPSEGPNDLKAKMEEAIATFENPEEVLFLVDLWSGTPFNQATGLVEGHEKWAIVTGLNLPMLVEAYGARLSMETAHEIAAYIVGAGREGIKVCPESLEPKKEEAAPVQATAGGAIPEGTVIGDGKIKYVLARIDTRLLHGQVATTWTKTTKPNRIIVVSDSVAHDDLRKKMIEQAAPPGVKANVVPIDKMIKVQKDTRFGNTEAMLLFETPQDALRAIKGGVEVKELKANVVPIDKMIKVQKDTRFGNTEAMLLFETPQDALRAIKGGVEVKELNLGSMAHSVGKVVANKAIAMDAKDIETIEELKDMGIKFDVRKVPSESGENIDDLLKKAKAELAKA